MLESPPTPNATAASEAPVLKIKLSDHQPYEKLAAIRAARADAELVVDANQSWDFTLLRDVIPKCQALDHNRKALHWMMDFVPRHLKVPSTVCAQARGRHTGLLLP